MIGNARGLIVAATLLAMHAGAGAAESYPTRPVRIIIPSGVGGITDNLGRVIAPKLTEGLGQQVVIDIREDIKRIQCPTLVIGTDTARRGRAMFEIWQKTIPNSELVMLEMDGYHAAGTDPDITARVTLDFIARHSTR